MKRILCYCLSILLLVATPISPTRALIEAEYTFGDVNFDSRIDAADALLTLQLAVTDIILSREAYFAADVSGDTFSEGYFWHDAVDALLILQYAVGKINRFPAQDLDPDLPPDTPEFTPDGVLTPGQEVDFVVEIPQGRDIRILQLCDLQPTYLEAGDYHRDGFYGPFGASMSSCVWPYVSEAIRKAKPDLIVLTGDNVEGGFDDNGKEWQELCETMDSFRIPWMIVFGNHDRESKVGTVWQTAMLHLSDYCLFASADCTGDSNYTVAVKQGNAYKYILWLLDTNGTSAKLLADNPQASIISTDVGLRADQIRWMKNTAYGIEYDLGEKIPSLLFMHIPPFAANLALTPYSQEYMDSPFVPNLQGDFGIATESPGGWGSEELMTVAPQMNCKGMFFGHQHRVAISIGYQGIRFTWGLKSSASSYYDPNLIGGTLITIDHKTNDFNIEYLFSDLI